MVIYRVSEYTMKLSTKVNAHLHSINQDREINDRNLQNEQRFIINEDREITDRNLKMSTGL